MQVIHTPLYRALRRACLWVIVNGGIWLPIHIAGAQGDRTGGLVGDPPDGGGIGGSSTIVNPLKADSLEALLEAITTLALQIGIPVAVFFIIYAGLKFILARGNETEIGNAIK